ncbi:hypothetical protein DFJ67_0219 [Asanoa ferruginea]|uniref:DNA-binding protein n=1 Tax=Asanoa ferruginea TaxID=53367 RepID=A0A3D9ZCW5_9ACTN|nr:hypothetical protein [Asanoa ferruginea]REF94302.1 hypothetical protein DFJ67_0219 [Asanoa ferruginea]GIF53159.1 hypothetical protein Afe04nite_76980 [Asanoa ferruginea]
MRVQHFLLVVERPPSLTQQRRLAALPTPPRSETGADGTHRLTFDRPGSVLADAIAVAIHQVELTGLRVVRVADRDWLTLAEIGARIGRSRELVRLWALGKQGPGGFPAPLDPDRDTSFYSWAQVSPWLRERLGYDLPDDEPILAATNLALQLRALAPRIQHMQLIRDLLAAA